MTNRQRFNPTTGCQSLSGTQERDAVVRECAQFEVASREPALTHRRQTMSDLREQAAEFYARQGYEFGPDNVDIVKMLAEFADAIRAEAVEDAHREWAKYDEAIRDQAKAEGRAEGIEASVKALRAKSGNDIAALRLADWLAAKRPSPTGREH